jgi:hydrogenase-4 component E
MTGTAIADVISGLAALILLMELLIVASGRLQTLVRAYALQSVCLGLLAAAVAFYTGSDHIYIVAVLTIVVKGLIIPRFLTYAMERIHVSKEVEPSVSTPASLLIAAALTFLAYYIAEPIIGEGDLITSNCLPISLAVVLIGLFVMIARKKAMTEVIGLLSMENGLFLAAISMTYGMPMIVELGIFFDILVAVIIMGVFLFRINRTFETLDTSFLRRLHE